MTIKQTFPRLKGERIFLCSRQTSVIVVVILPVNLIIGPLVSRSSLKVVLEKETENNILTIKRRNINQVVRCRLGLVNRRVERNKKFNRIHFNKLNKRTARGGT